MVIYVFLIARSKFKNNYFDVIKEFYIVLFFWCLRRIGVCSCVKSSEGRFVADIFFVLSVIFLFFASPVFFLVG
jgi:hypothetical protein